MNRFYLGVLLVLVSATGFGLMPIFALHAYAGGINITTLLLLRFTAAAAILFLYILLRGVRITLGWRQIAAMFVMGAVLYMLQSTCYFTALKHISPSLTALLLYTYPILVAILARLVDREKLSALTMLGIPASFAGLVLVLGVSTAKIDLTGVALALAAPLVYSCYILIGNRLVRAVPSLITSAFVSLSAAVSFLAIGTGGRSLSLNFAPATWWPLAGIVICSTVAAMFTFFKGLELIGSTRASLLSMFEPVVTIGCSVLLLGETLRGMQVLGMAVVLGGSLLVVAGRRPENKGTAA